jgi:hypothetical protein
MASHLVFGFLLPPFFFCTRELGDELVEQLERKGIL